jgi:lipid A 3-O-deacylase
MTHATPFPSVLRRSIKLACAAICSALPVGAQSFSSARLVIDNDFIAIRDGGAQDQDYSSGVRIDLAWRLGRGARVGRSAQTPLTSTGACCQLGLSLGQELYTPSRDGPEPIPGERAYAAWLYLEPSYLWRAARYTNVVALRLGWIGPPALGEQTQNSVHQLIRSEHHVGWRNQARIGPAYLLSYRLERFAPLRWNSPVVVVQPSARIATGNVETSFEAGGEAWVAQRHANNPAPPAPRKFYALFATKAVWKVRDALLSIDPDGPATAVSRNPVVGEAAVGCGFAADAWSIEYRYYARTSEYATQASPHRYGSIRFGFSP